MTTEQRKEEIKVVEHSDAREFERLVNLFLKDGFILHGESQYTKVSCQDTWDGRQRSWTEQSYVQVLKRII